MGMVSLVWETSETRPEGGLSGAFWDKTIAGGRKVRARFEGRNMYGATEGSKASAAGAECKCHPSS